jgi:hypothetical protein
MTSTAAGGDLNSTPASPSCIDAGAGDISNSLEPHPPASSHKYARQELALRSLIQRMAISYSGFPCIYLLLGDLSLVRDDLLSVDFENAVGAEALSTFWSSAFRWISFPHARAEHHYLIKLSCTCSSYQKPDLELHARGEERLSKSGYKTPFVYFLKATSDFILDKFVQSMGGKGWSQECVSFLTARRESWPTRLNQILPHGTEDTTRGLLTWLSVDLDIYSRTALLQLIDCFLHLTHPMTFPSSHSFISSGVLRLIGVACKMAEEENNSDRMQNDAVQMMYTATTLLCKIVRDCGNEAQRRELMQIQAPQLLEWYDQAIAACDRLPTRHGTKNTQNRERLIYLSSLLLQDFPQLATSPVVTHTPPLQYMRYEKLPSRSWSRLLYALDSTQRSHRCSALACRRTLADGGLRWCGGCRRVAYCSRRCQKADWNQASRAALQHRGVCAIIRRMCHLFRLPRRDVVTPLRIGASPLEGSQETVAQVIADYFLAHAQNKMANSRTCNLLSLLLAQILMCERFSRVPIRDPVGSGVHKDTRAVILWGRRSVTELE